MTKKYDPNLNYQNAPGVDGASYTESKLRSLNLPRLSGLRFLDLGCNAGFYCGFALDQGAAYVVGVDSDPRIIEKAKSNYPKAEFYDCGWENFPDGTYDIVVCLSAIHYADNPIHLTSEIHAHLTTGGLLVLEAGVCGINDDMATDILIPTWRKVGDRCRHLSYGFLEKYLLANYVVRYIGQSVPRAGDPVPRMVIHAEPKEAVVANNLHQLDLVEYSKCLSLSGEYIAKNMPSYRYVTTFAQKESVDAHEVEQILNNGIFFEAFMNDLMFAIAGCNSRRINLAPTISYSYLKQVIDHASGFGVEMEIKEIDLFERYKARSAPVRCALGQKGADGEV